MRGRLFLRCSQDCASSPLVSPLREVGPRRPASRHGFAGRIEARTHERSCGTPLESHSRMGGKDSHSLRIPLRGTARSCEASSPPDSNFTSAPRSNSLHANRSSPPFGTLRNARAMRQRPPYSTTIWSRRQPLQELVPPHLEEVKAGDPVDGSLSTPPWCEIRYTSSSWASGVMDWSWSTDGAADGISEGRGPHRHAWGCGPGWV